MLIVLLGDNLAARRCTRNIPHDNILPCPLTDSGTEYGSRLLEAVDTPGPPVTVQEPEDKYLPPMPVCSAAESESKQESKMG